MRKKGEDLMKKSTANLMLVLVTVTAGLFDTAAFYTAFSVLAAAVVLKGAAWWVYSRR